MDLDVETKRSTSAKATQIMTAFTDLDGVDVSEHTFVNCSAMAIPDHELTALIRSAAMAAPSTKVAVEREQLIEAFEELLQQRCLLRRLGDDLRTVARSSPTARSH